jgi:hypothetical protein
MLVKMLKFALSQVGLFDYRFALYLSKQLPALRDHFLHSVYGEHSYFRIIFLVCGLI